MKTNAIIRIVLFSLAILVLLGILLAGLEIGVFMEKLSDSGISHVLEEVFSISEDSNVVLDGTGRGASFDASEIRELEIEWVAGNIIIQPHAGTQIELEESAVSDEKYQLIYKKSDDTLNLQFCEEHFNGFGISFGESISKDLIIQVPMDWVCDSLEIDTASARVEIRDLTIGEVDFDGASGVFSLENCVINELDIDTASGDVAFRGSLNILDFDAASANFTGNFTKAPRRLDMDAMSGDMEITLPADCGFSARLDSMSGGFHSDFPTQISGDTYIYGDGSCQISISGMSSDIKILKGTE